MHYSEYNLRLLAEQRRSEAMAEAARLSQLHNARRRHRGKSVRPLIARFRRPAAPKALVYLSEVAGAGTGPETASGGHRTGLKS